MNDPHALMAAYIPRLHVDLGVSAVSVKLANRRAVSLPRSNGLLRFGSITFHKERLKWS